MGSDQQGVKTAGGGDPPRSDDAVGVNDVGFDPPDNFSEGASPEQESELANIRDLGQIVLDDVLGRVLPRLMIGDKMHLIAAMGEKLHPPPNVDAVWISDDEESRQRLTRSF